MTRLKTSYFNAYFTFKLRGKLPSHFAVVTACDPMGREAPPAANRRRDAALSRRLKALKIRHFRVTGGTQDGSHREPGWGLIMESPKVACALAAQFNQDAYFWISKGRIYLGSADGGPLHRAGSWAARQAIW
ncbi:MAG: DUF3293 domain-containing protein [Elusimicrobiota bacterium]